MNSFWHWILDNKEWLFSGIFVAVIGYVAKTLLGKTPFANQKVTVKSDGVSTNSPAAIGHTVSQSVHYQIVNAPLVQPESHRVNKDTFPSAHQILNEINALPPFQRLGTRQNYLGLEICWLTEFANIADVAVDEANDHMLVLSVRGEQEWDRALVMCGINLNKYPKLKILHAKHPIWIRGKISGLDSAVVHVKDPELEIVDT
jgi:hypothetical protein